MEARRQTTLARVRWQAAKHNEFVGKIQLARQEAERNAA
jgi:hypothetical protein